MHNWLTSLIRRATRDHMALLLAGSFVLLGLIYAPSYRYQINPDGVSYISIADHYYHLHIKEAINGYWSPLFSWLIIPSFIIGIKPILFIKLLQVLINAALVYVIYILLSRWDMQKPLRISATVICGLLGLSIALVGPLTPDMLLCLLVIILFTFIVNIGPRNATKKEWITVGFLGALLFLTKAVGLYMFIGIMAAWTASDYLSSAKTKRRQNLLPKIWAIVICGIVMLPFLLAISIKYRAPTLGSSGKYNLATAGPDTVGHPTLYSLLPPPNKYATSAWEDPTYIPVRYWMPFKSLRDIHHFTSNSLNDIAALPTFFGIGVTIMSLPALMYFVSTKRRLVGNLAITIIVLSLAFYIPIYLERRYIMPAVLLLLVGYFCFVNELWTTKKRRAAIIGIITGLFLVIAPLNFMQSHRYMDREVASEAYALQTYISPGSRVAGDDFVTLYACFYTKSVCYSTVNVADRSLVSRLHTYKVQYLLLTPQTAKKLAKKDITFHKIADGVYLNRNLYLVQ